MILDKRSNRRRFVYGGDATHDVILSETDEARERRIIERGNERKQKNKREKKREKKKRKKTIFFMAFFQRRQPPLLVK